MGPTNRTVQDGSEASFQPKLSYSTILPHVPWRLVTLTLIGDLPFSETIGQIFALRWYPKTLGYGKSCYFLHMGDGRELRSKIINHKTVIKSSHKPVLWESFYR